MFSCEYHGKFKNTYFEEHLQTAASNKKMLMNLSMECNMLKRFHMLC